MSFEVEVTSEFSNWWDALSQTQQHDLNERVRLLEEYGPALRRPVAGEIKGSKFSPQMKELICNSNEAHLRVLFIFDPRRTAILLIGGDKTGQWEEWYRQMIPIADKIYKDYLNELKKEGAI